MKVGDSGSADLYSNFVVKPLSFVELYSVSLIKNSSSASIPARFFIGQDSSRDLTARAEIKQSRSVGLHGRFEIGQDSAELFARLDITWSVSEDLVARFEVTVYNPIPVNLKAIFSINRPWSNLGSILRIRHLSYSECLGRTAVRHTGAPVELRGDCEIRQPAYSEFLGRVIVKNVGSQDLPCSVTVQSLGDLYATFKIRHFTQDSVIPIADDDLVSFLDHIIKVGEGFISGPTVEDDEVEKMVGSSSFKITSAYAAGRYKEIRFGYRAKTWMQSDYPKKVYSKYSLCPELEFEHMAFVSTDINLCTSLFRVMTASISTDINLCTSRFRVMTASPTSAYDLSTAVT